MIDERDVERAAKAGKSLAPAASAYLEEDFVMNLLDTVLDYQLHTKAVVKALEYFRANRWREIRTLDDLDAVLSRFPDDQQGNTMLARYLWNYNLWTRAQQLRGLVRYLCSTGVVDQESLKAWAHESDFRRDFQGRVKGLGPAVYQWLIMRQGVDTVKPDVHVRRFAEDAFGRQLSDDEVVEVVTRAARLLNIKAYEFDWRIWEASRGGSPPHPTSHPAGVPVTTSGWNESRGTVSQAFDEWKLIDGDQRAFLRLGLDFATAEYERLWNEAGEEPYIEDGPDQLDSFEDKIGGVWENDYTWMHPLRRAARRGLELRDLPGEGPRGDSCSSGTAPDGGRPLADVEAA